MDRQKFSTIAHRDHEFFNPTSAEKIDRILSLIPLTTTDNVIDVGCGRAEMLIRLCGRTGAQGIGIDLNTTFIEQAQQNAVGRVTDNQIMWINQSVADVDIEPNSLTAALCIGSTHAFGNYHATLTKLGELVQRGGYMLVGEGYWKTPPSQDYLDFLGATVDDYGTHADNIQAAANVGLKPLYAVVSNDDEWDHYEGLYARAIELYTYANPDDSDVRAMQERISKWRDGYLQWGRATLGFGLYLFLRP